MDKTFIWHQDKDHQGSISQILTGSFSFKWLQVRCDGCSFNLFCYMMNLNDFSQVKSDGQKSYSWRTIYQSAIHIKGCERQCPKIGQIWRQIPNMQTCIIPMLQSSTYISQTIFYRTQINVSSETMVHMFISATFKYCKSQFATALLITDLYNYCKSHFATDLLITDLYNYLCPTLLQLY